MRYSKEIKKLIKSTHIANFPIGLTEINQIIKQSNWEIYSYRDASDIIDSFGLRDMAKKNDSFVSYISNRIVIFYDDNISQLDFPHILAHEIGHIVLGHFDDTDDIYSKERDCNCFANELLGYVPNHKVGIFCGVGAVVAIIVSMSILLFNRNYDDTQNSPTDTGVNITISIDENVLSEHIITDATLVYITQYGENSILNVADILKTRIILSRFQLQKQ